MTAQDVYWNIDSLAREYDSYEFGLPGTDVGGFQTAIEAKIKEFAEYHVKLALKAALESIPCLGSSSDIASYEEVEKEVLNAYALENIK